MDEHDLISTCDACAEPIADGEGRLWIDYALINQHGAAVRAWEAETAAPDGSRKAVGFMTMFEYPSAARWNAHHAACDPDPDAGAYSIDIQRIRTWGDLAHWTASLMGFKWLPWTDWKKVLGGIAAGDGTRLRPVKPSKLNA